MKISREWLQTFFAEALPSAEAIAEALTFHAFEIESIENDVLDVKVTPNRGHDCLSHRGIAKEISAILNSSLANDPLAARPGLAATAEISVRIEDIELCPRYIAGLIKGVKVGPSAEWLVKRLEAVGQKSINNVVDATNYVMFNTGQPLHAFDAAKLKQGSTLLNKVEPCYAIQVRRAKMGEKMLALDEKTYTLADSMLAIVDGNSDVIIGIAGVKGGKPAGITGATKDIIIESANFDGVSVRKTAQALKLRTDASDRFQQVISPELAAYGMQQAVNLILAIAGGELVGFADEYPNPAKTSSVTVSTAFVNKVLGTAFSDVDVENVFKRLWFSYEKKGSEYVVQPSFERLDITIPEDLAEEVGRIEGYDTVPAQELPPFPKKPEVNVNFYAAEKTREELISKGYSEVYTSVFSETGEQEVLNKVGGERPYLRESLLPGLKAALEKNISNRDLLALKEIKIFEIGVIWRGGKEETMVGVISEHEPPEEKPLKGLIAESYDDLPVSTLERYETFSRYPFIVRDIAMWVPDDPDAISKVLTIFANQARELLRHVHLFDQFKKDNRVSYAFRLVLQSFEKTLTDQEANTVMERIYAAVRASGWEVR